MKSLGFSVFEGDCVTFALRDLARGLPKQFAKQTTPPAEQMVAPLRRHAPTPAEHAIPMPDGDSST